MSEKVEGEDGHECENAGKGTICIEDWEPVKKTGKGSESGGERAPGRASPKRCFERRKPTYDEILQMLEERIQHLLKRLDFTTGDARSDLKFVQRQTRYSSDVLLQRRIVDRIVKLGIAHVYLSVWKSVSKVDYLQPDKAIVFKNLQTILSVIWNCTDKSVQLCDSLVRCGVIQLCVSELSTNKLASPDLSENTMYLVKAYLGILHNIIRHSSDSRRLFRSAKAVTVLQLYLQVQPGLIKTKAYLILSYIIDEHENDLINSDDENIAFIIEILKDALNSENHFSKKYAFWATEIICGLNHLAINDGNKRRMGQLGALPLYVMLLQGPDQEEQNLASAGLWILSFQEDNKMLLKQEAGCLQALQELAANSPHENVRRAARGALWVVKLAPDRPLQENNADIPHIMVSYHHKSSQKLMVEVKNKLRAAGYKVWMDVDNMRGSTLEAMALAVEKSIVVLVCMTQGYKDSPSCRTEAEYTYRLRKDIVPLQLQSNYVPDGWLGVLVGTRLFFDFSSTMAIEENFARLVHELGTRGFINNKQLAVRSTSSGSSTAVSTSLSEAAAARQLSSSMSSSCSMHSYVKALDVPHWTQEDVQHWLHKSNADHLADKLSAFDGEMLLEYHRMQKDAPQFFFHSLEDMLKLDLVGILRFSKLLRDLV